MEAQRRFLKQMNARQVTIVGHILDNALRKDYLKPSEIKEGRFFLSWIQYDFQKKYVRTKW